MPIDLIPLTSDWLDAFNTQRLRVLSLSDALQRWLVARLDSLDALERRTRAFPVFAFDGLALSLSIDPQQHGALRAYRNAGSAWAAPFVAFGRGFTRIPQAVEDELVLPNLLGAVEGVIALIARSIDRLIDPRASTFDPRNAHASDLFGLMAMAWRGLITSTGQLRLLVADLGAAQARFATPTAPAHGSAGPVTTPSATGGGAGLDDAGRWLTGAILLLPILPNWIATLADAAWLRGRLWLLDTLQGIEARVFELRREVLGILLESLPGLLREVPALVAALGTMLQGNIRYFAVVARIYFEVAILALNRFLHSIYRQVNGFIGIINGVFRLMHRILHFDLLDLIKPLMGPAGKIIDLLGVHFTVDDLIEVGTGAVNMVLYGSLKTAIITARGAIHSGFLADHIPWAGSHIHSFRMMLLHKLDLLEQVIDALFRNTGGPMAETVAPTITPMPNFYDLLFGAPPADLARSVREFGSALAANVRGLFERVATSLDGFGATFARTATDVARTGPATRMARFARESADLSNGLFDDQIQALGARIRSTPPGSFEHWLVRGGFEVIGAAIPLYVAEMRRWWQEQTDSGDGPYLEITPTSPHILARRARLGRVRVPRLVLRAGGRAHDEPLVRELARRFRSAVGDAYDEGQRRLALAAAATG